MAGLAAEKGDIEPVVVDTGRTGQVVSIRIFRTSDNFFLDWSDNTFKTAGSVVTLNRTLVEVDSANAPGIYKLATAPHSTGLNTGLLTNLTSSAIEDLVVIPSAPGPRIDPGLLKIVPKIDGVLGERSVMSRLNAMARGRITLTGAPVEPAQDAVYHDETGTPSYTNRNTGNERNPVP